MIHHITIDNWRPARDNQLMEGHWTTKHKLKSSDAEVIGTYAKLQDVPPAKGRRRVSMEIVLAGRWKKADPLAYAKSLLDALKTCRLLVDDSDAYMVWGGVTYSKGPPQTTIVLEDL